MSQTSHHVVLFGKLKEVRRKYLGVTATAGLAMVVSSAIAAATLEMAADWLLDLPWLARAFLLAVMAAVLAYLGLKYLFRPLLWGPDDDELALAVEREHPRLGGRLIASVQFTRPRAVAPGLSHALVQATLSQAITMSGEFDFRRVVKTDQMKRRARTSAVVVVGWLLLLFRLWPASGVLLARMFLSTDAVPRWTRVVPVTTSQRIAIGDDLIILADAEGIRPADGAVDIRFGRGGAQQLTMEPVADVKNRYGTTLKNVQESFRFRVTLGDGTGEWYDITVMPRPTVTGIWFWEVYPDYTHVAPQKRLGGDLSLLEGSRLIVAVKSSSPLKPSEPGKVLSRVHLTGSAGDDQPLIVDGQGALTALAEVPKLDPGVGAATDPKGIAIPDGTNGLSVTLVDSNGMESKDSVVYPISLVAPHPPTAQILIADRREQLVTLVATFNVPFDASADYGLGRVSLVYKVDGGEEHVIPMEMPPGNPRSFKSTYTWQIDTIEKNPSTTQPTLEGSAVEYWLRASDTQPTPLVGNGDHYQIRVVTPEEKRQELLIRAQVIPQGIRQTESHQEKDNNNLGSVIMGGQTPATAPATQPAGAARHDAAGNVPSAGGENSALFRRIGV